MSRLEKIVVGMLVAIWVFSIIIVFASAWKFLHLAAVPSHIS